jgi:hypothetical protein
MAPLSTRKVVFSERERNGMVHGIKHRLHVPRTHTQALQEETAALTDGLTVGKLVELVRPLLVLETHLSENSSLFALFAFILYITR